MIKNNLEYLWEEFKKRNRRILSRLITQVEAGVDPGRTLLERCYPHTGKAFRIGITGPPGSGKSTLVNSLLPEFRKRNLSIAILATDPTSLFSGGALLGDRLRMGHIGTDSEIFMRSMASRGALGGLSEKAQDVCDLMDAYGFDLILIETVGVGQLEMDILQVAHTIAVVISPEDGDEIQVNKAGLMEIGDLYVVNKAEKKGARTKVMELEFMVQLKHSPGWVPPVLTTQATEGKGIIPLVERLFEHKKWLEETGQEILKREKALENKIRRLFREDLEKKWNQNPAFQIEIARLVPTILQGLCSLTQGVKGLVERFG